MAPEGRGQLSVAKRHGLIEARVRSSSMVLFSGYPWQNATASLKQPYYLSFADAFWWLSVAKRHGLIEAYWNGQRRRIRCVVIRGKTPRPH